MRPNWVPALPPEVRTLGSGVTSLLVALAALMAIGYGAHLWLYETQGANADILGAVVGVLVIYFYALADKMLGMNTMSRLAQQVIMVLIPPLALIFLVLGTIFLGLATPTEGGAMGAVGALILAGAEGAAERGRSCQQALAATTRLSAFVMFILIGARVFSLTFYGVNGHVWVEHLLTSAAGRADGLPDHRRRSWFPPGLLPRLLRARLHHRAAADRAGRGAGDRPDLVRASSSG